MFRYLLLFSVPEPLRARIVAIGRAAGLDPSDSVTPQRLHVTVCTLLEQPERASELEELVRRALDGAELFAPLIRLGRVAGNGPTMLGALGPQNEMRAFFQDIVARLAGVGLLPLYRRGGLHAHVTLSYRHGPRHRPRAPVAWRPDAMLLVESDVGAGRHLPLASWPLLPPRQAEFAWGQGEPSGRPSACPG